MRKFTIYGLCGPSGVIRYVGMTCLRPSSRLSQHRANKTGTKPKRDWIASLGSPKALRLVVLEQLDGTRNDAAIRELQWVIWMTYDGVELLNEKGLSFHAIKAELAGSSSYLGHSLAKIKSAVEGAHRSLVFAPRK